MWFSVYLYICLRVLLCERTTQQAQEAACVGKPVQIQQSSSEPQVNKLETSEKSATFLSRRITLGVKPVVFLTCAVGELQI